MINDILQPLVFILVLLALFFVFFNAIFYIVRFYQNKKVATTRPLTGAWYLRRKSRKMVLLKKFILATLTVASVLMVVGYLGGV